MDLNRGSPFERNPKKTLFFLWIIFFIFIEAGLKSYVRFLDNPPPNPFEHMEPPGTEISNVLTHHGHIPHSKFTVKPTAHDNYEPVLYEINSIGIRGPEIGAKTLPRVLFVGDSFLEANRVIFEKTFSELLNNEFKNQIQFITHGVSSWAPTTEFSWIHNVGMSLRPDEICLFLVWNDFFPAEVTPHTDEVYRELAVWKNGVPVRYISYQDHECAESPRWCSVKKQLLKILGRLELAKYFYNGYKKILNLVSPPMSLETPVLYYSMSMDKWPKKLKINVDHAVDVIARLNAYLKERGVRFYVTNIPNGLAWKDELVAMKTYNPAWSKIISDSGLTPNEFSVSYAGLEQYLFYQLTKRGIEWFSLTEAFNKKKKESHELLYINEDAHWNWRAHKLVFEVLRNRYKDSQLLR